MSIALAAAPKSERKPSYEAYMARAFNNHRVSQLGAERARSMHNPIELALNSNIPNSNSSFSAAASSGSNLTAFSLYLSSVLQDTKTSKLEKLEKFYKHFLQNKKKMTVSDFGHFVDSLSKLDYKLDDANRKMYKILLTRLLDFTKTISNSPMQRFFGSKFMQMFYNLNLDKTVLKQSMITNLADILLGPSSSPITEKKLAEFCFYIQKYDDELISQKVISYIKDAIFNPAFQFTEQDLPDICIGFSYISTKALGEPLIQELSRRLSLCDSLSLLELLQSYLMLRDKEKSEAIEQFVDVWLEKLEANPSDYLSIVEPVNPSGPNAKHISNITLVVNSVLNANRINFDQIEFVYKRVFASELQLEADAAFNLVKIIIKHQTKANPELLIRLSKRIEKDEIQFSSEQICELGRIIRNNDIRQYPKEFFDLMAKQLENRTDDFEVETRFSNIFFISKGQRNLDDYRAYTLALIETIKLQDISGPASDFLRALIIGNLFLAVEALPNDPLIKKLFDTVAAQISDNSFELYSTDLLRGSFLGLSRLGPDIVPRKIVMSLMDSLLKRVHVVDHQMKADILFGLRLFDKDYFDKETLTKLFEILDFSNYAPTAKQTFKSTVDLPGQTFFKAVSSELGLDDISVDHKQCYCENYLKEDLKHLSPERPASLIDLLQNKAPAKFKAKASDYIAMLKEHKPEIKTLDDLADFIWGKA